MVAGALLAAALAQLVVMVLTGYVLHRRAHASGQPVVEHGVAAALLLANPVGVV